MINLENFESKLCESNQRDIYNFILISIKWDSRNLAWEYFFSSTATSIVFPTISTYSRKKL